MVFYGYEKIFLDVQCFCLNKPFFGSDYHNKMVAFPKQKYVAIQLNGHLKYWESN